MNTEKQSIRERALRKVKYIIAREGTDNGQRLQPWYLKAIEDEIRQQDKISDITMLASAANAKVRVRA